MKLLRRNMTVLLLLLSCCIAHSQEVGLILEVGPRTGPVRSSQLQDFYTSYNAYFSDLIQDPFKESTNSAGFRISGGGFVGPLTVGFGVNKLWSKNTVTWNNQDKQHLSMVLTDYVVEAGLGSPVEEPVDFHINFGMVIKDVDATIWYEHNDGTKDYAPQFFQSGGADLLNGFYKGWRLTASIGGSLGFQIIPDILKLNLRADYTFKGKESILGEFDDPISLKAGLNGLDRPYLPQDVNTFYNGSNTENLDNVVNADMGGLQFGASLLLTIFS